MRPGFRIRRHLTAVFELIRTPLDFQVHHPHRLRCVTPSRRIPNQSEEFPNRVLRHHPCHLALGVEKRRVGAERSVGLGEAVPRGGPVGGGIPLGQEGGFELQGGVGSAARLTGAERPSPEREADEQKGQGGDFQGFTERYGSRRLRQRSQRYSATAKPQHIPRSA